MAEDYDLFASKFLLNRAATKSRAKSWLGASLPDEVFGEDDNDNEKSQSLVLSNLADDELSGVGAPKQHLGPDGSGTGLPDRQLASANDALRRKLMSREAYGQYRQGNQSKLSASKPMPKKSRQQQQLDEDDSEDGGKGKGSSKRQSRISRTTDEAGEDDEESGTTRKSKKRPASYLDQLLAERGKKKRKVKSGS